ncbi:hypothetical protein GC170_08285 [bacterium]|nr:hypothetical protein [bacterium]
MYGLRSRMVLILTVSTALGVHVARSAERHLADWRIANAFASDAGSAESTEPRYSLVVRAGGEPLVEDESTLGVFKLSAGPLRFDVALYDECLLRSDNEVVEESPSEMNHSDRMITVFVDPEQEELAEECMELLEDPETISLVDPIWVLLPPSEQPLCDG